MRVVRIEPRKRGRVLLVLEPDEGLIVSTRAVREEGIRPGDECDPATVERLRKESRVLIRKRILHLLSRRELSSHELKRRLVVEGHSQELVDGVITELTQSGVIDDDRYARSLIHDWTVINPKGDRAIEFELVRNGLKPDRFRKLIAERDELSVARSFLRKLHRTRPNLDRSRIRNRLYQRGFTSTTIDKVLDEIE